MPKVLLGKALKTTGLIAIGVGVGLIILGEKYDPSDKPYFKQNPSNDTIIDAVWSEVD